MRNQSLAYTLTRELPPDDVVRRIHGTIAVVVARQAIGNQDERRNTPGRQRVLERIEQVETDIRRGRDRIRIAATPSRVGATSTGIRAASSRVRTRPSRVRATPSRLRRMRPRCSPQPRLRAARPSATPPTRDLGHYTAIPSSRVNVNRSPA